MRVNSIFVGFLHCPPGHHDAFLDWHEQDHRPENHGVIEHIYHSARFVAPPDALADRVLAADGPFADPGQYLMTYWSSAPPQRLLDDMTTLREALEAAGRCAPINRDFRAVWRDRMQVLDAAANPLHVVSSDAAPFVPLGSLVVTVGEHGDGRDEWEAWYRREGMQKLFVDPTITASFTLAPMDPAAQSLFVHLHFAGRPPREAQAAVAERVEAGPAILFQGAYVPQHAGEPRFYA